MAQSSSTAVRTGGIVVAVSTLAVLVAAFLTWMGASAGGSSVTANGIDLFNEASPIFNGVVTIVLGLVATVLALVVPDNEGGSIATALLGVLISLVAITFVLAPGTALGGGLGGNIAGSLASVGLGVYVTLLGGLGVIAGGLLNYSS